VNGCWRILAGRLLQAATGSATDWGLSAASHASSLHSGQGRHAGCESAQDDNLCGIGGTDAGGKAAQR